MFNASPHILKRLAALVWYSGVVILLIKSGRLLLEATQIDPDQPWTWLALLVGITLGAIKARYIFCKLCIKNLQRIDMLKQPKIWNFYRPQFFIFLFLMISLGAYLSRIAHDDYIMLISVAVIDLAIATALLGSSYIFWKQPE